MVLLELVLVVVIDVDLWGIIGLCKLIGLVGLRRLEYDGVVFDWMGVGRWWLVFIVWGNGIERWFCLDCWFGRKGVDGEVEVGLWMFIWGFLFFWLFDDFEF